MAAFVTRYGPHLGLLAVLVATLSVFAPTLSYDLLNWDDKLHITVNPLFGDLGAAWTQAQVHVYMPVTWSLWALAWDLGGADPSWLHGLNVFGHLLGVVLAYHVLLRLPGLTVAGPTSSSGRTSTARWAAVAGAALFALHPLQVEPVAWVTCLKDIASADFALAAMLLHLRATERRSTRGQIGAVCVFALATLCKPTIVALVPAMALVHLAAGRKPWRRDLVIVGVAMVAVALPALVLTAMAQFGAASPPPVEGLERMAVVADSFGHAIGTVVWPGARLGMAGRSPMVVLDGGLWVGTGLALAGTLAVAVALRRRWPELLWGVLFMLATLLPVSGLLPFGAQLNTTVADRYLHLALLGPAWSLAAGAARLVRARRSADAIGTWPSARLVRHGLVVSSLALATIWTTLSIGQVQAWSSDIALWTHTLDHDPDNRLALENLAQLHNSAGDHPSAIAISRHALDVDPTNAKSNLSMGSALARLGRLSDAAPYLRAAVEHAPQAKTAWLSFIRVTRDLDRPGDLVEAVTTLGFDGASQREVAIPLAEAHLRLGDYPAAVTLVQRWLQAHPEDADAHAILGVAHGALSQPRQALRHLEKALSLQPDHPVARRNVDTARAAARHR
ncbi:MAG: hypothetical protein CVU56_05115 [Deltaproteobacteria bacterium HGW-Deltaproteobacteria-14]|nr:MAG: hypothetical protein CVU56_05115 [Deltaproteobacteria bacterium HGW-Deltaproteobacteria-14]